LSDGLLMRKALSCVLEGLLRNELASVRGGAARHAGMATAGLEPWTDDLHFGEQGDHSLGCDSLDQMRLAAATNEMFHLYEVGQELALLSDPTFGSWLDAIQTAWRKGVFRITFATSGSTGTPKRCTHDFAHLRTEIRFLAEVFAGRTRIVLFAPPHHIYGFLFGAMLPSVLVAATALAATPGAGSLNDFLQAGDLVVSFPERWHWLEGVMDL